VEEKRSFVGAQLVVVLLVDIQDDDDDEEEDVEHANDDDVRPLCIALLNLLIRKSFIVVADGRARDVVFDVNILLLLGIILMMMLPRAGVLCRVVVFLCV